MGQNARSARPARSVVTIDWFLLAVAIAVLLFCLAAFTRVVEDHGRPVPNTGLQVLDAGDTLLAFQDFSFGGEGWAPATTTDRLRGLGPVLGPISDNAVRRLFVVPETAVAARLQFDVHLARDWVDGDVLRLGIDGQDVLVLSAATDEEAGASPVIAQTDIPGISADVVPSLMSQPPPQPALPDATADLVLSFSVSFVLHDPGPEVALHVVPEGSQTAQWALDNLTLVSTTRSEP